MDADFEKHYQAAERAYGLGEYAEAQALTSALWDQLQSASNEHDPGLVLSWRAVVSLLLGHIQLHGLKQTEQAAISYERVLQGDVGATIAPGETGAGALPIGRHRQRSRHDARNQWRHPRSAQGSLPEDESRSNQASSG